MSVTPAAAPVTGLGMRGPQGAGTPIRRVRHQARDAVALMAFSASTSIGIATGLLVLAHLGR
jgi:hypothetical protein